jgi:photosystem II stability/assembly factor-like uncharacterized protein
LIRKNFISSRPGIFCDNARMRCLLILLTASLAVAQSGPQAFPSHTTESLRGVSAVSRQIAWVSGTHGTYLRTLDRGRTWTPAQVPNTASLDFRAVVAFSAGEAFLMSSGPGDQSRIYHTSDAGQHWQLQFSNIIPKGFFDSMLFWDAKHGIVLGDPVPDDSGKLKFEILMTADGQTWHQLPPDRLPPALDGEGAFAASNSCLAILHDSQSGTNKGGDNIWFATGGKAARVFHSPDRGQTWEVFETPILHGPDSAGIFSIAFRDALHGVIAGGDYKHPDDDGPDLAFTSDGGKTWNLWDVHPQAYFSAVAYDQKVNQQALQFEAQQAANPKQKKHFQPRTPERLFIIGRDFIFDFRPPVNPHRIGARKNSMGFNAVSPFPDGGALIVGPKGSIALIP